MFQPAPRRHRRLPSGTMVSYAEVKSYLSKREIPQLFESLMAGLMYHRPENHIGYLQSCLEEVKSNSDTKVQWSTFVNAKKRKSKEILPPLTPKKQDSISSSWSDNSRQSTPLPPISARTRMRASMEQQDYRNTYILYHNPPPILAKPKVPVVSVLGGLGTKIDELCERVVGRLRGVVHISTCSMLKTRMTIEGFYRVTSVPACAVVDSVLQAMSMVQSASALLVAGFPRNRGDIEEYRSRRVRMDGVILVDFEEEALRGFLEHEVASGIVRTSEIEAELERFKQDIISVAEYYDEKELLTVVMGDQDIEEIIDDLILAVDKVIETRKNITEDDAMDGKKAGECGSPCNALMPSPDRTERPSTVEIRDATEEDIRSIEEEAKKIKPNEDTDEEVARIVLKDDVENSKAEENVEAEKIETKPEDEVSDNAAADEVKEKDNSIENSKEEINEESKEKESHENEIKNIETDEEKLVEDTKEEDEGGSKNDEPVESESERISQNSPKQETIGIANNEAKGEENVEKTEHESLGEDTNPENDKLLPEKTEEELRTEKPDIPLIFAIENINVDYDEIKNLIANDLEMCFIDFYELMRNDGGEDDKFDNEESLNMLNGILKQDCVSYSNGFFIFKFPISLLNEAFIEQILKLGNVNFVCKVRENKPDSELENFEEENLFNSSMSEKVRIIFVTEINVIDELRTTLQQIINNKNSVKERDLDDNPNNEEENESANKTECENQDDQSKEIENKDDENEKEDEEKMLKSQQDENKEALQENEMVAEDKTEDSTGKDIEDLISDDTLNEGSKPPESLKTDHSLNPDEAEVDNTHSQASTIASVDETQKERAVLERQPRLEIETDNVSLHAPNERQKGSLIRQGTYSASDEMKCEEKEDIEIKEKDNVSDCENKNLEDSAINGNNMNDDAVNNNEIKNVSENPSKDVNMTALQTGDSEVDQNQLNEENKETETVDEGEKEIRTGNDEEDKEVETVEDEENKETETVDEGEKEIRTGNDEEDKEVETVEDEENKEMEIVDNEENKVTENEENNETEILDDETEVTENVENKETETLESEEKKEMETTEGEETKEMETTESEEKKKMETTENEKEIGATENEEKETETAENKEKETETAEKEQTTADCEENKENGEEENEENTETKENDENIEAENVEDEAKDVDKLQDDTVMGQECLENNEGETAQSEKNDNENNKAEKDCEESVKELNDVEDAANSNKDETLSKTEENLNENEQRSTAEDGAEKQTSENEPNENADSLQEPEEKTKSDDQSEHNDQQNSENNKSEKVPENAAEEHNTNEESAKCESTSSKDGKDAETDKENSTSLKISNTDKHKALDNDSDSNDENVTIETKAEIHAVDCVTPPTAETAKSDNKNAENQEAETKSDSKDVENEDQDVNRNDISLNNEQNEALNKENFREKNDEKESDTLSIKDIDSMGNERYSGKRQERNGSGILDESRQDDERESEEPQERSSSSSRGEL